MSSLDTLVTRLSELEVSSAALRQQGRLLRAVEMNPAGQAAKVELGKYVETIAKEVVEADRQFLRSADFIAASNKAKADAIRNIMEPGVFDAYDIVNDITKRFYNTVLQEGGYAQRTTSLPMDINRINAATANIIERTMVNDQREIALITEAEKLVRDAYANNIRQGNRDVLVATAAKSSPSLPITVVRQVRSANPCEFCQHHDGAPVKTTGTGIQKETTMRDPNRKDRNSRERIGTGRFREVRREVGIDEPVIKFHDNCSCELVLFYG